MCNYEKLLHDASMIGLEVKEIQFESDAKGLCKGQKIGIRKDLSDAEKACVLAEEIGHYYTTVGNILNQKNTENRKQEIKARKWAVDKILTIEDVFEATEHPCNNLYEVAEYLGVTEEFLLEALEIFKKRYGHSYTYNGKTIIFCDYGFCIK